MHSGANKTRVEFHDGVVTIIIPVRVVPDSRQSSQPDREQAEAVLTRRQIEVFSLLIDGKVNKEISAALNISLSTAKLHVVHILERLHLATRVELMRKFHLSIGK